MQKEAVLFHQTKFVQLLKFIVPAQVNLAKDLMDLLEISQDAAYRRLRCETSISLDETVKICLHYSIPLEALNNEVPDVVTFQFNTLNNQPETFQAYLTNLGQHLNSFKKHEFVHIQYAAEDVPVFYHFGFNELAEFKMMYWMKSILNVPELETVRFPFKTSSLIGDIDFSSMYQSYSEIPGTEIWTSETIESSLQQIRFYWDAGFFEKASSARMILDQLELMIRRISKQAEIGQKIDSQGASTGAPFQLYLCDLMIGNNSIYITAGNSITSFIGYNTFNSIVTRNEAFNKQHFVWMENLKRKSIQISGMAEKIRNQFFKAQIQKIDALRAEIVD
ncbi:MAG: hypothetical protein WED33_13625 [Bacteroidia bacterium]